MAGTALVLGGGGVTGIGWEIGMLAGLAEAGVNLCSADVVIGTSAGSLVGAQLTSGQLTLEELYERQLAGPSGGPSVGASAGAVGIAQGGGAPARMGAVSMARFAAIALRSRDAVTFGARMGRLALAARTGPENTQRAVIAGRLLSQEWPARRLMITAVDAYTGERSAFDGGSGVKLADAVAASCAVPGVWPPVTIGDRRWIDGGVHSCANADLAAGYGRVVVIAPMASGGGPVATPRAQAARLAADGAEVLVVTPDRAARAAFGRNVLDPSKRAAAARAGRVQAAAHASEAARVWAGGADR
ncbi:patatin-like phospholipase family protein [Streptomyces olivaceiscleroticus]|uniref:Patatin-like phospholipase family protein n=1 Tax=Streptomyces olivaceiscleroticus TaxID=68245 RepID=A0ABN0ZZK3_9ACTN